MTHNIVVLITEEIIIDTLAAVALNQVFFYSGKLNNYNCYRKLYRTAIQSHIVDVEDRKKNNYYYSINLPCPLELATFALRPQDDEFHV